MDWILFYSLCISAIFAAFLVPRLKDVLEAFYNSYLFAFLLQHFIYRPVAQRLPVLQSLTWVRASLFTVYTAVTQICTFWSAGVPTEASLRAGWLAVINMTLLFVTGRVAVTMQILGLSLNSVRAAHWFAGLTAVSQAATHVIIELRRAKLDLRTHLDFYGLLAAVGLLGILCLQWTRSRAYHLFQYTHGLLAFFVVFCVWCHPKPQSMDKQPFLAIGVLVYAVLLVGQLLTTILKNTVLRRTCTIVEMVPRGDGLQIELDLGRPFHVRPGQFIYLWMPTLSFLSLFRTHPFMVSWQLPERFQIDVKERFQIDENNDTRTIKRRFSNSRQEAQRLNYTQCLLLEPNSGLNTKLKRLVPGHRTLTAWLDGPYGNPPEYGKFSTVIFVAYGAGIAAQMLAIKHLIENFDEDTVMTRKISLYWRFNNSLNAEWVKEYFDYLMLVDEKRKALDIEIYNGSQSNKIEAYPSERIKIFPGDGPMFPRLRSELSCVKGRVLLSVCADPNTQSRVRSLATQRYYNNAVIRFHQSDFEVNHHMSWLSWFTLLPKEDKEEREDKSANFR